LTSPPLRAHGAGLPDVVLSHGHGAPGGVSHLPFPHAHDDVAFLDTRLRRRAARDDVPHLGTPRGVGRHRRGIHPEGSMFDGAVAHERFADPDRLVGRDREPEPDAAALTRITHGADHGIDAYEGT